MKAFDVKIILKDSYPETSIEVLIPQKSHSENLTKSYALYSALKIEVHQILLLVMTGRLYLKKMIIWLKNT